ncbi:MAG: ABC transporter ATP-binding protein [Halobacteriales archaeon]
MAELTAEKIFKEYSDVIAVNEVDLSFEDGEFVTLVGPSGCGKTTTLEMIAGLTEPTSGRVMLDDRDVTDLPPKDRGVAMVFQNIALFPHMDVYDNISYGLRLRDFEKEEIDRKVDRAVDILQLDGMLDRMPDELSGGQRQRVAIGRAIVRDPDLFLLDEPLANLDAKLRTHMRTELQRIQRELGVTTVYVTHDQEDAMTMSDRIAIMNDGELQQIAPPLECYNRPANVFVGGFIGSPSMNFFEGRIENGEFETGMFSMDLETEVGVDGDVVLGIRPEDIYPVDGLDSAAGMTGSIRAVVDVIEPMGDEIMVYMIPESVATEIEGEYSIEQSEQLLMSAEPDSDIEEQTEIEVVFDTGKIHLFDARTEEAITHGLQSMAIPSES